MLLFDFYCPHCKNSFEELVRSDVSEHPCPICSYESAERQISTPTIDPNPFVFGTSASSGAIDKWDKNRRRKIAREKKDSAYHE